MNRLFSGFVVGIALLVAGGLFAGSGHAQEKSTQGKKPAAKPADAKVQTDKKADPDKSDDMNPSIWMKKKLDYSQNILAGVTSEDFDKIADNARAMKGLGKFEAFVRSRNKGYTRQLQIFEEINDEIIRQADNDNVEGVALAFTQLTVNCVNCHKVLRQHIKSGGE